jgi:hypothetical protein
VIKIFPRFSFLPSLYMMLMNNKESVRYKREEKRRGEERRKKWS